MIITKHNPLLHVKTLWNILDKVISGQKRVIKFTPKLETKSRLQIKEKLEIHRFVVVQILRFDVCTELEISLCADSTV